MNHEWIYEGTDFRKCKNCLMEEILMEEKWIWNSSDDFMESLMVCDIDKKEADSAKNK